MGVNIFQFFVDNIGILNVYVEIFYLLGSVLIYILFVVIYYFFMYVELLLFGLLVCFVFIGIMEISVGNVVVEFLGVVYDVLGIV